VTPGPARLAAALAALACAACQAPTALYHWNGYDDALYRHYRQPQDREAYVASLRATIDGAREKGQRVPPGIYAEYGYALYEEGRAQEAIPWFELEARDWPESRILMQKMIRNAGLKAPRPPGAPAPAGPAGALEGRAP
jgi:hypothetical protein